MLCAEATDLTNEGLSRYFNWDNRLDPVIDILDQHKKKLARDGE